MLSPGISAVTVTIIAAAARIAPGPAIGQQRATGVEVGLVDREDVGGGWHPLVLQDLHAHAPPLVGGFHRGDPLRLLPDQFGKTFHPGARRVRRGDAPVGAASLVGRSGVLVVGALVAGGALLVGVLVVDALLAGRGGVLVVSAPPVVRCASFFRHGYPSSPGAAAASPA